MNRLTYSPRPGMYLISSKVRILTAPVAILAILVSNVLGYGLCAFLLFSTLHRCLSCGVTGKRKVSHEVQRPIRFNAQRGVENFESTSVYLDAVTLILLCLHDLIINIIHTLRLRHPSSRADFSCCTTPQYQGSNKHQTNMLFCLHLDVTYMYHSRRICKCLSTSDISPLASRQNFLGSTGIIPLDVYAY